MDFLLMPEELMDPDMLLEDEGDWKWQESDADSGRKRKLRDETDESGGAQQEEGMKPEEPSKPAKQSRGLSSWQQVEDLAADLDGNCSLSALGVDLNSSSYNVSDAILSLPSLTVFKQELPSPPNNHQSGSARFVTGVVNRSLDCNVKPGQASSTNSPEHSHHFAQPESYHSDLDVLQECDHKEHYYLSASANSSSDIYQGGSNHVTSAPATSSTTLQQGEDCRFQYVLAAATSIATKVTEESLTYLNQGQSYEIKLKKLGDLSDYRGRILKSVVRLCFHERRLQFTERQQMTAWETSRPGDRLLEVDLPLSYGLTDVYQDPTLLNTVQFLWDPTKEVGAYIKVNCISTEFTPKKHGGEKGVPFRIKVETYILADNMPRHLHSASCQIKVFKLKGADRKHKQDREKVMKRPLSDQDKYQPSYECTVLNDVPIVEETSFANQPANSPTSPNVVTSSDAINGLHGGSVSSTKDDSIGVPSVVALGVPCPDISPSTAHQTDAIADCEAALPCSATAQQTALWLAARRFSPYLRALASFSGADLLRLSRDDLIQICGLPDGIRLYNAIHAKSIAPRLTLYLCVDSNPHVHHALFLGSLTSVEMAAKLAALLGVSASHIHTVYIQGPAGIHVLLTDELVANLKEDATYAIEIMHSHSGEYRLLLKPTVRQ